MGIEVEEAAEFAPYVAEQATESTSQIEEWCHAIATQCVNLGIANRFGYYRRFVGRLLGLGRLRIVPLKDLLCADVSECRVLAIRHDVDGDIITALRAARFHRRADAPATFFLLHTSRYYGYFVDGVFLRQPALGQFVDDLCGSRCEVGLHVDALGVYVDHGVDGAAAVATELQTLRAMGAEVRGTVAHNSAAVYGAENFEVFKGRSYCGRRVLVRGRARIPLQTLDEQRLALSYEGNYPVPRQRQDGWLKRGGVGYVPRNAVRSYTWLYQYLIENPLFERQYDMSIWLLGRDAWAVGWHRGRRKRLMWPVRLQEAIKEIDTLPVGGRAVVVIHPEYIGAPRKFWKVRYSAASQIFG